MMLARERVKRFFLDILFPRICIACKKYLAEEDRLLCGVCFASVPVRTAVFREAGMPVASATTYASLPALRLVHALKYERMLEAASVMERIITAHVRGASFELEEAVLIPVPLHPARLRTRGFNQAEAIAEALAATHHCRIEKKALIRTRNTGVQARTGPRAERYENVRRCFRTDPGRMPSLKTANVVLIDDVYTTGATMREAAKALRRSGVRKIQALVFARTE